MKRISTDSPQCKEEQREAVLIRADPSNPCRSVCLQLCSPFHLQWKMNNTRLRACGGTMNKALAGQPRSIRGGGRYTALRCSEILVAIRRRAHTVGDHRMHHATGRHDPQAVFVLAHHRIRVRLDVSSLLRKLEYEETEVKKAQKRLSSSGLRKTQVCYEDLVKSPKAFESILAFLRVSPESSLLKSSLRKLNTAAYNALIENFDEVAQTLEGTRFTDLLC